MLNYTYVNKMKRVSAQHGDTKENYNDIRYLNSKWGPRFYDSKDIPIYARYSKFESTLMKKIAGSKHGSIGGKLYFNCQGVGSNNKSFTGETVINYEIVKKFPAMEIKIIIFAFLCEYFKQEDDLIFFTY